MVTAREETMLNSEGASQAFTDPYLTQAVLPSAAKAFVDPYLEIAVDACAAALQTQMSEMAATVDPYLSADSDPYGGSCSQGSAAQSELDVSGQETLMPACDAAASGVGGAGAVLSSQGPARKTARRVEGLPRGAALRAPKPRGTVALEKSVLQMPLLPPRRAAPTPVRAGLHEVICIDTDDESSRLSVPPCGKLPPSSVSTANTVCKEDIGNAEDKDDESSGVLQSVVGDSQASCPEERERALLRQLRAELTSTQEALEEAQRQDAEQPDPFDSSGDAAQQDGACEVGVEPLMDEDVSPCTPPPSDRLDGSDSIASADDGFNTDGEPQWLQLEEVQDTQTVAAAEAQADRLQASSNDEIQALKDLWESCPSLMRYAIGHPAAFVMRKRRKGGKGGGKRYFGGEQQSEDAMAHKIASGCWACGQLGHDSQDCEFKRCFICSERGHEHSSCWSWELWCEQCGRQGHLETNCPMTGYQEALEAVSDISSVRCLPWRKAGHVQCGGLGEALRHACPAPTLPGNARGQLTLAGSVASDVAEATGSTFVGRKSKRRRRSGRAARARAEEALEETLEEAEQAPEEREEAPEEREEAFEETLEEAEEAPWEGEEGLEDGEEWFEGGEEPLEEIEEVREPEERETPNWKRAAPRQFRIMAPRRVHQPEEAEEELSAPVLTPQPPDHPPPQRLVFLSGDPEDALSPSPKRPHSTGGSYASTDKQWRPNQTREDRHENRQGTKRRGGRKLKRKR
mmetsp:Transcript_81665/g.141994  ORF Transcript_81665/g.141994 Transcript_81665/m.141994 type:complete len:744 (-) Transcript_81665:91-2322(-)